MRPGTKRTTSARKQRNRTGRAVRLSDGISGQTEGCAGRRAEVAVSNRARETTGPPEVIGGPVTFSFSDNVVDRQCTARGLNESTRAPAVSATNAERDRQPSEFQIS